jgi:hypothetical protein
MEAVPCGQVIPCPDRKSRVSRDKKGCGSSFPDAGFRRFSPAVPLQPRLLAETKKEDVISFRPALFGFGDCFSARATRKLV